ncbi:hypothetical protein AAY473_016430 [Plecturocebus cupreus]
MRTRYGNSEVIQLGDQHALASQSAGITDVSHHVQPRAFKTIGLDENTHGMRIDFLKKGKKNTESGSVAQSPRLECSCAILAHYVLCLLGSSKSPTTASRVARISGMYHHTQIIFLVLVEMGFRHVGQAGLELLTSNDSAASVSQSCGNPASYPGYIRLSQGPGFTTVAECGLANTSQRVQLRNPTAGNRRRTED